MSVEFAVANNYLVCDLSVFRDMLANYKQKVRGKTLFDLLARRLSQPGRATKFSSRQLAEFASTVGGPNIESLVLQIKEALFGVPDDALIEAGASGSD